MAGGAETPDDRDQELPGPAGGRPDQVWTDQRKTSSVPGSHLNPDANQPHVGRYHEIVRRQGVHSSGKLENSPANFPKHLQSGITTVINI